MGLHTMWGDISELSDLLWFVVEDNDFGTVFPIEVVEVVEKVTDFYNKLLVTFYAVF